MPFRTNIAYRYDGSIHGLMCCVFESYEKKELPSAIITYDEEQVVLYEVREIVTDKTKSMRVLKSIPLKLGQDAMHLIEMTYYSDRFEKELKITEFLRYAFSVGPRAASQLTHPLVSPVHEAARAVSNEAAQYNEFIRFSEYNGVLVSEIEPKAFVLPLIIGHFRDRLPSENFLIYDKTHKYALLYSKGRHEIAQLDDLELPRADSEELRFRALWRMFYDTIAVEGRTNQKCRMGHLPKRFWSHMTEFQTEQDKQLDGALPLPNGRTQL